jgi:hypothetical protein
LDDTDSFLRNGAVWLDGGFIFKEWSCLIGCTYSLKLHYHRTIAEGGNFFMVVELIIKKRQRKKGGKSRKKKGEREGKISLVSSGALSSVDFRAVGVFVGTGVKLGGLMGGSVGAFVD